ncbi:MAG: hypothetical protein AABX33_07915 [Nanoarchaeota archaeon]
MIGKTKKSQGMPIEIIIIAALALIVLVVLAVILANRTGIFTKDLQSCPAKQGECTPGTKCPSNKALITNTDCKKDQVCCIQVFNA